jgi:UDP:flavonoid glycosyltransferase YjiC (YdhE family)
VRLLLAASGGEGHLGPLLPFAAAAEAAGDEVVLVVPPEQEETVRSGGHQYVLTAGVLPGLMSEIRGAMAVGTREDRVRLAEVDLFGRACTEAALPAVETVCDWFDPELILREPCDYASAIVAHRRQIPMAQVAISPGRADWNGLHLAAEVLEPATPGVTSAVEQSPYLSRFPEIAAGFQDTRAYGFAVQTGQRQSETPPLVWVTFGTVNSSFGALESTWRTVLEAASNLPVRVIASVGRGGPDLVAPHNVEVFEWIELSNVLARASVVVCHGGSGTTLDSRGRRPPRRDPAARGPADERDHGRGTRRRHRRPSR